MQIGHPASVAAAVEPCRATDDYQHAAQRGGQERVIKDMDGHSADSKAFRRYYTIERSTKEAAVKAQE